MFVISIKVKKRDFWTILRCSFRPSATMDEKMLCYQFKKLKSILDFCRKYKTWLIPLQIKFSDEHWKYLWVNWESNKIRLMTFSSEKKRYHVYASVSFIAFSSEETDNTVYYIWFVFWNGTFNLMMHQMYFLDI